MTHSDMIRARLSGQQLSVPQLEQPQQVVALLGAMQAQEYAMAKWAIGLRLAAGSSTDALVEKDFNEGKILRTHLLRPTWHFVAPGDIRWMLALTGPRVHAGNALYYRKTELDDKVLRRSRSILTKALRDGNFLTRTALQELLGRQGIVASGLRLVYLMMHAELEGLVCSGPREGKQFTYALLEERAAPAPVLRKEEALAALALRYFGSRWPASLQDFVWWSGLTVKEAKEGMNLLPARFAREAMDGTEYIIDADAAPGPAKNSRHATFLMPDYDEYGIAYKDRSALSNGKGNARALLGDRADYARWIVVDGVIDGAWSLEAEKKNTRIAMVPFSAWNKRQKTAVARATDRYLAFKDLSGGMVPKI